MKRLVSLLALLVILGSGCTQVSSKATPSNHPPIAVLVTQRLLKSSLVAVDLRTFAVVDEVPLRSLCLDIDAERDGRVVATAQCGGVGSDADNKCGLYEPGSGKSVRYIPIDVPNPGNVVVTASTAQLIHGFLDEDGFCTSSIDMSNHRIIRLAHVPPVPLQPKRVGGRAILSISRDKRATDIVQIEQGSVVETICTLPFPSAEVARSDGESEEIVAFSPATMPDKRGHDWRVRRISIGSASVVASAPVVVNEGICDAAVGKGQIAYCDSSGLDPDRPGRTVHVLDYDSLTEKRKFSLAGRPAHLEWWGENLLVLDEERGELLMYGPDADRPSKVLDIDGDGIAGSIAANDFVVLDGRR